MKKVLIVANLFHASPRIPGIATYLPEFGWEARILTPPVDEKAKKNLGLSQKFFERVKIIEAPYKGDIFWFWRRIFRVFGFKTTKSITEQLKEIMGISQKNSFIDILLNWYQTIFAYPDTEKTWKKPAIEIGDKLLKRNRFHAILSSSPFPTSHLVAFELKKKFNTIWVADLRDLWTQNHNYPYPWLRKMFEQKLELKVLSLADFLVTVSQPWAEELKKLHKRNSIEFISNGFDPEYVNEPPVELTKKFTITYTGQIYSKKQDPLKILLALKELVSENSINSNDIEVRFYGPEYFWLAKKIEECKLSNIVKQYGKIPREISLKKQWESQLLLFFNWEDPKEKGVYTGKIFEYLAAKRPILAIGGFGGDVVEELLKKTKAGVYCQKVEDIKNTIKNFYWEYKNSGKVAYRGIWKEIQKYSFRELAKKYAEILNKLI